MKASLLAVHAHQAVTAALLLAYAALPLLNYPLAVRAGVKRETADRVGPCAAEAAHALSVASAAVFLPLQAAAAAGLARRRRWAVPLSAAAAGIALFAGVLVLALNRALPPSGAARALYGPAELAFHLAYLAATLYALAALSVGRAALFGHRSRRRRSQKDD